MREQQPKFVFNLLLPVFMPTQEELAIVHDDRLVEPFFQHLLKQNYLTHEELAAFLKFITYVPSFLPALLDEFLRVYREEADKDMRESARSKLVLPA